MLYSTLVEIEVEVGVELGNKRYEMVLVQHGLLVGERQVAQTYSFMLFLCYKKAGVLLFLCQKIHIFKAGRYPPVSAGEPEYFSSLFFDRFCGQLIVPLPHQYVNTRFH